jgi:hypothetical protein
MAEDLVIYSQIKKTLEGKIYFFYHAFIYLTINLVLYILNHHILAPFRWHIWVLLSWGLALYFHFIAALIFNPLNRKRWRRYLRSRGHEKSYIDFFYHLHIYIGVNGFLLLANKLTTSIPWSIYPFFFWGLGLIIHFALIRHLPRQRLWNLTQNMKNSELFEAKIYLLIHLFVFLFFNLLIFTINLVINARERWFLYPIIGWGLGLFFHAVWIFLNKSHRIKRYKQKRGIELMKYYR